MKSTEKRDLYAEGLDRYREEVPIDEWPVYRGAVSRSGLARAIQARGYPSFERKRLESAKCRPILKAMDHVVSESIGANPNASSNGRQPSVTAADSAEVRRLRRRVVHLEKDLKNAERREVQYRERCALLEAEKEGIRRQHDAFEQHCHTSLRTLHV